MSPSLRTLVADRGDAGVRIDLVLRRHLTDVDAATRTRVQAWIAAGHVTVNGLAVRRAAARAARGDVVSVRLPDAQPRRVMAAEDVALDILYEDAHLLALDKPAGIVVHPTYRHATGTIMNALLGRARGWPDGERPSIVGRLDKSTSGIVIAAKTRAMHAALQRTLNPQRTTGAAAGRPFDATQECGPAKDYLAVVYGNPPARGEIDLRLRIDGRDRRRVVASAMSGARSVTVFECLARVRAPGARLALLQCRLLTGRRHQIRVHLAARGWPIVGDAAYGEPSLRGTCSMVMGDARLAAALRSFPRQALHAWRLAIRHPATGRPLRIEAPPPADITALLAVAGLRADGPLSKP